MVFVPLHAWTIEEETVLHGLERRTPVTACPQFVDVTLFFNPRNSIFIDLDQVGGGAEPRSG